MQLTSVLIVLVGLASGAELTTFDASKTGTTPPGWMLINSKPVAPFRWEVRDDHSAPSRPNVLALTSREKDRHIPSLAVFQRADVHDGDVSVDFRLDTKQRTQTVGIVFRYQDPRNYYLANASADTGSLSLLKVQDGKAMPLLRADARKPGICEVPHNIDGKSWNIMRVKFRGAKFVLYLDHRKMLEAADQTFARSGKTGVWSRGDTAAFFDNFKVDKKN